MNVAKDAAPKDIAIYRPKQPSDAESRAQKRQVELIADDAKRICTGDIHRPFTSLQDALDRLLPYHILGGLDGEAADWDETAAEYVPDLLVGRRDALADLALHRAADAARKVHAATQRVQQVLRRRTRPACPTGTVPPGSPGAATAGDMAGSTSSATAVARTAPDPPAVLTISERHMLERVLANDAREMLELERHRAPGYRSPTAREDPGPEPLVGPTGESVGRGLMVEAPGLLNMAVQPGMVGLGDGVAVALEALPDGSYSGAQMQVAARANEEEVYAEEEDKGVEDSEEDLGSQEGVEAVQELDGEGLDDEGGEGVEDLEGDDQGDEGDMGDEGDVDAGLEEEGEAVGEGEEDGVDGLMPEEEDGGLGYADDGELDYSDDIDDLDDS